MTDKTLEERVNSIDEIIGDYWKSHACRGNIHSVEYAKLSRKYLHNLLQTTQDQQARIEELEEIITGGVVDPFELEKHCPNGIEVEKLKKDLQAIPMIRIPSARYQELVALEKQQEWQPIENLELEK